MCGWPAGLADRAEGAERAEGHEGGAYLSVPQGYGTTYAPPPMGYGPQYPPPSTGYGPDNPPAPPPPPDLPLKEPKPKVPLREPKPEPRGYGTHVPQTPYMASTSEPTPIKRAPLSFHSTGVHSIPSRPTAAQPHSEMGVQTFADFHHPVK